MVEEESRIPEEVKGERLLQESSYEKAAEFFHQAAESNHSHRSRLYHRAAVAYWKAGVFDKAAQEFKAAIRSNRHEENRAAEARTANWRIYRTCCQPRRNSFSLSLITFRR